MDSRGQELAKDDMTRRMTVKVAKRLNKVLVRLNNKMPLGPDQVEMTDTELRRNLKQAKSDTLVQFIEQLGSEGIMSILKEQQSGTEEI